MNYAAQWNFQKKNFDIIAVSSIGRGRLPHIAYYSVLILYMYIIAKNIIYFRNLWTYEAGTAYPTRALEFTHSFSCPFVLFILSFVINFFYFHQSLLNTALWNGSAGFWVTDELNTTNSTYSNTKAHPQKMT